MEKQEQDLWLAHVKIQGGVAGSAEIYIDGKRVHGVIGYSVEHNSSDKRTPILNLQVQCDLEMDSGAIPLLPEPWCWFYKPISDNFVSAKDYLESSDEKG